MSLARTIFRDSSVIILDEPSSSLDVTSENAIFKYVKDHCQNKIVIFIAHRLSNILLADYIIFLKNGEVCEMGSGNDLMKTNGEFWKLYQLQK